MAWLYVPGLAGCPSGSSSPSLTTGLSVQWRGKYTPLPFLRRAWRKAPWMSVLSGMTCPRLMAEDGVDSWISSRLGCPASRTAPRASDVATRTSELFGLSSFASLGKWSQPSSSWRTSQGCLPFFDPSETSYSEWTIALRRLSLRRRKLALRTAASGCSSWPSLVGFQAGNGPDGNEFSVVARAWSSPRSEDGESCGNHPEATDSLTGAIDQWQTPAVEDFASRKQVGETERQPLLEGQAAQWSTPAERDYRTPNSAASLARRTGNANRTQQLVNQVEHEFPCSLPDPPTPPAGAGCLNAGQDSRPLWTTPSESTAIQGHNEPDGHRGQTLVGQSRGQQWSYRSGESVPKVGSERRLNPLFVTWLMGLPPAWNTVTMPCGQPEMASFREQWRRRLSAYWQAWCGGEA